MGGFLLKRIPPLSRASTRNRIDPVRAPGAETLSMRILGIDPGLANTGYGIIDHDGNSSRLVTCGCVNTPAGIPMAERLRQIHDELVLVISKWKPDAAAVEQLFFARNVTTAITVAQGRGVAILAMAQSRIPLHEYSPMQIKQAVTGSGKADKAQITRMVTALLALNRTATGEGDTRPPATSHAADALAVALCHAHAHRFHERAASALAATLPAPPRPRRR